MVEIRDSQEDAGRLFARHIAPNLPDPIRPELSFHELHDVMSPTNGG